MLRLRPPVNIFQIQRTLDDINYMNSHQRLLDIADTLALERTNLTAKVGSMSGDDLDLLYQTRDTILQELRSDRLRDKVLDEFDSDPRRPIISLNTDQQKEG